MKKHYYFIFVLTLLCLHVGAQQFPPVTFPSGKNLCDATPYKLVFDEEFDGNTVDYSKWRTWISTAGGTYIEDDNNEEARWDRQGGQTIIRDQNVLIGGGICTLQIKHGPERWKCDSCPVPLHYANYSSGWLTTRYRQWYNNGRFEARIKLPRSDYTWSTMWLYHDSGSPGINEIDIVEAHGGPFFPFPNLSAKANQFKASYSLHAQQPSGPTPGPNPYHLVDDEIANSYPNHKWINKVQGDFFDLDNWHTYTCEWDTALISTYLDGNLIHQEPKYYYRDCIFKSERFLYWNWQHDCVGVWHPAICTTDPTRTYHIMRGFPWNNNSKCNLRFSTQMFGDETTKNPWTNQWVDTSRYLKAEMKIDYVRIWQRHPIDSEEHYDLCANVLASINGPNIVCSTATYTVIPAVSGGTWSAFGLNITSQTSNSVTVQKTASSVFGVGYVYYNYGAQGCENHLATKMVDVGPPSNAFSANIVRTTIKPSPLSPPSMAYYILNAQNVWLGAPVSSTTYNWNVWFGPNYSYHVLMPGKFLALPPTAYSSASNGGVSGTLTITNACGSRVINFSKSNSQAKLAKAMDDSEASKIYYYNAEITDTTAYHAAVEGRVQNMLLPELDPEDTVTLNERIAEIAFDELEPYLLLDSSQMTQYRKNPSTISTGAKNADLSRIYPNPAMNQISIAPSLVYDDRNPIVLFAIDIYGHKTMLETRTFTSG